MNISKGVRFWKEFRSDILFVYVIKVAFKSFFWCEELGYEIIRDSKIDGESVHNIKVTKEEVFRGDS